MTLDIIELLKQKVSATVLDGETDYIVEKNQALGAFYPFLLALLKAKPSLMQGLQNQLNPRISDLFGGNSSLKQQFLQHLSPTIPIDQTEASLNRAISPTLNVLENEAGTADSEGIAHFLKNQWSNIERHLPTWALPILAGLGVSTAAATHVPPPPTPVQNPKEEKKSGFLLPLIAFLILAALLAFLFKACNGDKKVDPATAATQASTTEAARLELKTGANGDLDRCEVNLNNPSYLDMLQTEVKKIFNNTAACSSNTQAKYGNGFVDQDLIPAVLQHVKGVPNTQLEWQGDKLTIQSANPADAEGLAAKINPLLKKLKLSILPAVAASEAAVLPASTPAEVDRAVNDSVTQAGQALSSIDRNNVSAQDVATALNLQIINFATASSVIPESNQVVLNQAADLIKNAPHVVLTVEGHTDTVGNAESNKTLSLQRAQAVAKYLVSQGVNPAQLKAVGFGQENPVADNTTEAGKFKNRRIEFKVVNTETGTVRTVDDQGVTKQP